MENQYQKVVNISYLVLAILVSVITLMAMMKLTQTYDLESKVKSVEFIVRGLAIVIGAGMFFGLYKNQKTNAYMNEVAVELLSKVSWPTRKDTMSATVIVIITVVLAGIVLAVCDWLFTIVLQWFWSAAQGWFV